MLKPCPFCGGSASFERVGTGRVSAIVSCDDCGARVESGDTGESSGASWNRRVDPSPPMGHDWAGGILGGWEKPLESER